jgi:hypothetical protein
MTCPSPQEQSGTRTGPVRSARLVLGNETWRSPPDTSIRYMDYSWYMSMKRTNVYADPEDLAIIKEAAKRRGISEAEIIRQGIHLAAMANRVWDEPLFSRTFEGSGCTMSKSEVRDTVAEAVRREAGSGSGSAA